ncbi:hypothetical protein L2649_05690 [Thermoactinomyces vulgaris]|uniref:hypothetical protein n=1 Tax=Thermoactinomyces vulgaris TaxID=2026 RepID=UPI001F45EC24|nr:hypothetical protein [Thermoactinomyces vulgaris]MCF6134667.1 hypothetical protein [Thermoactinomyces vulgaris]
MKNTYRGEPEHKENFSIDEFGLQVKRKALVFTSAGIACLIMTFSAYVIGMEETYPTASKLEQPLISKKKSNISEHAVNESRQLASADVDRPATTENNGETANTSIQPDTNPNDPAPSASNPSPKNDPATQEPKNHDLSDIVAIADPVGETPVYEKDDLVPSNDQKPKFPPPKFEWNQPGFLDHLIPCKPEPSKDCTKSIIKKPETNNDLKWIHLNPHHKDEDDKQSKRLNQSDSSDVKKQESHRRSQNKQTVSTKEKPKQDFKRFQKQALLFEMKDMHLHSKIKTQPVKKEPFFLKTKTKWNHQKSS